MKKVFSLILVVLLLCSLTACALGGASMEELCGQWEMTVYQERDTAETVLTNLDFYPEEIALVDLESLACVMVVEFNEDKTYSYYFDIEATKETVHTFFEVVMDDLYAGRETLSASYQQDLSGMTQDGFHQFYVDLFGAESYDALIDSFVESSFDYSVLSKTLEEGTFRIRLKDIYKTPDGKTEEESMGFSIDGNTLTLTYLDGDEVYTKR